jgi:2-phosphosulfolactate phosphatase
MIESPPPRDAISSRARVFAHLLPSTIGSRELEGSLAVVVDVLRATSVMIHALAAGCESIIPCLEIDEARAAAARLPRESVILGGERQGLPIEGFDLGNSPASYSADRCRGKTIVMTTTNGTKAILASLGAARVLAAAFSNLSATVRTARAEGRAVHVVCAGTDGLISFEDTLLAGAIVVALGGDQVAANDEARIAAGLWLAETNDLDGKNDAELSARLMTSLSKGRGGQRVREIGLGEDVRAAARVDWYPRVAQLCENPRRIVSVAP